MMSIDVGPMLNEVLSDLEAFLFHRIVQGRFAEGIKRIDVLPYRKEALHLVQVALLGREVKQFSTGRVRFVVSVHALYLRSRCDRQ